MNRALSGLAFMSCILMFSCKPDQSQSPSAVPVNLFTVKAQPVVYYDRYISTTAALSQVNLLPEVQGYITGIFFREGSHVKKGEKLYEIDRRIYEANYNTAAANLKVAEGNLKQAQQDADRYEYLNKNKAVAKQLYDHAMISLQNTQNAYQSAAEVLKNTSTNLAYSVISAPFDGTIGFSQVKLGDFVSVGQTVLSTVSGDDPMGVDFLINEKQLSYFENLQNGRHNPVDSLFTLILPDNSLYPYMGRISVLDRAVNPQTGSLRIRLVFPNPKSFLRAGMSCVVRVRNMETTPQLVIPGNAVVEEMGEYFVYVAKDSAIVRSGDTTGGKGDLRSIALQKKVHLGVTIDANVIIRSGINEGDKIVVDGVQSLHNGSFITQGRPGAQTGREGRSRQTN